MAKPKPKQTTIATSFFSFVIMMKMVALLCIGSTQKLMERFVLSLVHEKGHQFASIELSHL